MTHQISGGNFHGEYHLNLRGPAEGFILSPAQARKFAHTLCGLPDCKCGGGYGRGLDLESAQVEIEYDDRGYQFSRLIPALEVARRREAEAEAMRA